MFSVYDKEEHEKHAAMKKWRSKWRKYPSSYNHRRHGYNQGRAEWRELEATEMQVGPTVTATIASIVSTLTLQNRDWMHVNISQ